MDYEKKYKEALEKARQLCAYPTSKPFISDLQDLFPELAESDDERVRKELLDFCKNKAENFPNDPKYKNISAWIAWLEKQGQTFTKKDVDDAYLKGISDTKNELEKQGDQKSADKVELKFKVGDWITNGDYTWQIVNVTDLDYILQSQNGHIVYDTISHVDEQFHSFTIEDAKGGDVLHSTGFHNDCIFIFNSLDNWKFDEPNGDRAVATGYCCLFVSADNMEFGIQGPDCIEVDIVKPASKTQRDLLFQKMKEAGYEWNADKKELKKIEEKIAWSEEDEKMWLSALEYIQTYPSHRKSVVNWLKSIKDRVQPQIKRKWSEQDNINCNRLLYLLNGGNLMQDHKIELFVWFQSLKERYTWKPSDEQMETLKFACGGNYVDLGVLESLYQDLKKLKEE